ncbi:response regulator transcription factor [Halalkalibacter krulwichiae]|uniref:Transcriptional regulatory protein SrrA n=1 Tax=Halalkalibacter krulwichiae TaxID=199441 RepID=A0A1X9MGT2_9BACI|nr:response regulator transcription factor [Halalkalibacter krulwichiae]ARK32675.1 Transcriptional regulatory protein SrrA [Halalkalibacter krulwichiae]
MYQILVVDDERQMQSLLTTCIQSDSIQIQTASSGEEALEMLERNSFDLMLLDLMMPGTNGFQVLKRVNQTALIIPTIILSAIGETDQIVEGLNLGAYDYVTKPFEPKELVARVQAVLRRTTMSKKTMYGLRVHEEQNRVTYHGAEIAFTKSEFQLFTRMFLHAGRVFTREQLLNLIWDRLGEREDRTIDTHIKNIRDKLKKVGITEAIVETVWGVGYKISQPEEESK